MVRFQLLGNFMLRQFALNFGRLGGVRRTPVANYSSGAFRGKDSGLSLGHEAWCHTYLDRQEKIREVEELAHESLQLQMRLMTLCHEVFELENNDNLISRAQVPLFKQKMSELDDAIDANEREQDEARQEINHLTQRIQTSEYRPEDFDAEHDMQKVGAVLNKEKFSFRP